VKLTPSQVAKYTGLARGTIYRHMDEGKLSCEKDTNGQKVIDPSEAARVYKNFKIKENDSDSHENRHMIRSVTKENDSDSHGKDKDSATVELLLATLQQQIKALESRLDEQEKRCDEEKRWFRSHLDGLSSRLLTDQNSNMRKKSKSEKKQPKPDSNDLGSVDVEGMWQKKKGKKKKGKKKK
jgi:excisionase family DNA binding protein